MARFPYTTTTNLPAAMMPRLPLTLSLGSRSIEALGLLDTGAAVSVLPFQVGLALGAAWEKQTTVVPLVGSLGRFEARALIVAATHLQIIPNKTVRLVFAWTRLETAPIIFGQMNFFVEFDVCFYRSRNCFDVTLKDGG